MEVTRATFHKFANQLHKKVLNRDSADHDVCVLPVLFCGICHIRDGKYLPGDEAPHLEHVRNGSKYNMEFNQIRSPDKPVYFPHRILAIRASRSKDEQRDILQ